ncbi:MAG: DUF4384 domain-containing protein [Gemmatimonadota bacterium]
MPGSSITMLAFLLAAAPGPSPRHSPSSPTLPIHALSDHRHGTALPEDRPRVNVWLDHEQPFRRGDRARVYFKSERDSYVTVARIDTDGRLRVLFPSEPWEDNFAAGGRTFEVLGQRDGAAFTVDDYPGVGYIFAVSSDEPFTFDDFSRDDGWDYRLIEDGRVRGDPYVAMTDFASRIAGREEYDYDVDTYDVERHYDYPRFLCYDCHSYASFNAWNPYDSFCARFRIVVYDDSYYYPYRYARNRNVVIDRPRRPQPRFVFKDNHGGEDYVTRVRERPRQPDDRRVTERDRSSEDVGGRGAIPAPVGPRGRWDVEHQPPSRAPQPDESPRRRAPDDRRGDADPRTGLAPLPRPAPDAGRPTDRRPQAPKPEATPRRDPPPVRRETPPKVEAPKPQPPRSTGEPELRRRKPQ